jgi:hypothetical protein
MDRIVNAAGAIDKNRVVPRPAWVDQDISVGRIYCAT